jgi:hypothetical protein
MRKSVFVIGALLICTLQMRAQELQARVTVNAARIGTQVDRKVFQTLQTSLHNFLNNRKWTTEAFQQQEKITCNFLLNIEKLVGTNIYQASLTVQAARPVFNSTYETPLVNHQDDAVVFRYVEFQPLEFNENRVQGTDPIASNLSAVFAYYVYVILGMDYGSFSLRQGDPFYLKAQNIVNNAPESRDITGWKAFDGTRNRYWLMENLTNNRYDLVHDAYYNYFRLGMDYMYEKETDARAAVLNSLNLLSRVNTEIPNSMIIQFFFQGRSGEIIKIFKKAPPDEKGKALEILARLDVANAALYKLELR